ncbi:MAG TPA: hypothetical protein VGM54_10060 [Chthoniobacter sp.]|jgi:hypothetical protein
MAFDITPGNYYIGMWYFDIPVKTEQFPELGPFGKGGNFNSMVWREKDDGGGAPVDWILDYRFRYYRDERIHDHEDEMSWMRGQFTSMTAEEAEEAVSNWVKQCAASVFEIYDFFPIHGDSDAFLKRATGAPPRWMHTPKKSPTIGEVHRIF